MPPKKRFQRFPSPNTPDFDALVTVIDPEVYFEAQFYFQQFGIILVNLATGEHIPGLVNLPEIGMIIPNSDPKPQKPFGFIPAPAGQPVTLVRKRQNVDAILGCEGINQEEGQPQQISIQVVDHGYLESWTKLAQEIADIMTVRNTRDPRNMTCKVIFGITSLCSPVEGDQDTTKNAILSQVQGYGFDADVYVVSSSRLESGEDFYDEDEDEDEEEDQE